MSKDYRGGNSRLLSKSLDALANPTAILDRRGGVLFVNSALCKLLDADSTQLVGQQCSWQVAADDAPFAAVLTALAPPAGALQGRVIARQLSTPIVFGSTATGQIFIPLLDDDNLVHMTVVVLGKWEELQKQLPMEASGDAYSRRQADRVIAAVRSKWKSLDGLLALIGESPGVELAMLRAQLAIGCDCNFFVSGANGVGKTGITQAIFQGRLKRGGMQRVAGQLFPIDCAILDVDLLAGLLDVFAGRLRPNAPAFSQQLLLERIHDLSETALVHLLSWLEINRVGFALSATSSMSAEQMAARGKDWQRLAARLASIEIHVPALATRREDIAPLALNAMADFCKRTDRAQLTFGADALDLLTAFPWPGNLTQLIQAVEESVKHAVLSAAIHANHLPVAIRSFAGTALQAEADVVEAIDLDAVLLDLEKILLKRALKRSPRNNAQAARLLGISRPRLLRRMEQLGLGSYSSANSTPASNPDAQNETKSDSDSD